MEDKIEILNLYEDLIAAHLVPSHLLDHLVHFLEDDTFDSILKTEQTKGENEASHELISALKACSEPGWYQGFITGLKAAGCDFIVEIIEGHVKVNDQTIFKNLLKVFYANLTNDVHPEEVMPHLVETNTISLSDMEDISKIESRKVACFKLLRRVASSNSQWFPQFIHALKEANYGHIVEQIEPEFRHTETIEETERKAEVIPQVNAQIGPNTKPNEYMASPGSGEILYFSATGENTDDEDIFFDNDTDKDDYETLSDKDDYDEIDAPRIVESEDSFQTNNTMEPLSSHCGCCQACYNNVFTQNMCYNCRNHGYYNAKVCNDSKESWSKTLPMRDKPPIEEVLEEPPAVPPRKPLVKNFQPLDRREYVEVQQRCNVFPQSTQSEYQPSCKKDTGTIPKVRPTPPPKPFIKKNLESLDRSEHIEVQKKGTFWSQSVPSDYQPSCVTETGTIPKVRPTPLPKPFLQKKSETLDRSEHVEVQKNSNFLSQSVPSDYKPYCITEAGTISKVRPTTLPKPFLQKSSSYTPESEKYWDCHNIQKSNKVVCMHCETKRYPAIIGESNTIIYKSCDSSCHKMTSPTSGGNDSPSTCSFKKPALESFHSEPNINSKYWSCIQMDRFEQDIWCRCCETKYYTERMEGTSLPRVKSCKCNGNEFFTKTKHKQEIKRRGKGQIRNQELYYNTEEGGYLEPAIRKEKDQHKIEADVHLQSVTRKGRIDKQKKPRKKNKEEIAKHVDGSKSSSPIKFTPEELDAAKQLGI